MRNASKLTLGLASEIGHLIIVKCSLCHREAYFMAGDLVQIFGHSRSVFGLPFSCTKCRDREFLTIRVRVPDAREFGRLLLRRPVGEQRIQLWREERLR